MTSNSKKIVRQFKSLAQFIGRLVSLECLTFYVALTSLAFLSHSTTAFATTESCQDIFHSALKSKFDPKSEWVANLKIKSSPLVGGSALIFFGEYQGKPAVFRTLQKFDPTFYSLHLSTNQKRELASIDTKKSYQITKSIGTTLDSEEFLSDFDFLKFYVAEVISSSDVYNRLEGISYRGHGIAPKLLALIKSSDGIVIGQIIEYTPGKSLFELVHTKKISFADLDEAKNQITDQLRLLANAGLRHGDLSLSNVLFYSSAATSTQLYTSAQTKSPSQSFAYLIDFSTYKPVNKSALKEELHELNEMIERAKRILLGLD